MNKRQLKNLIKKEFTTILQPIGFKIKADTLFIKLTDENILQIVNFDLGSIGFTCSVAIQPLYIFEHTKGIVLNMGERLSRFKIVQKEWWSYDEPEKGILEIKELLIKNGLPWFEQYGSPNGIIEFISTGKVKEYGLNFFDIFHQEQYLAFSLLYTDRLEEGKEQINQLISLITPSAADFIMVYKKQLIEFESKINHNNAYEFFKTIVAENKTSLGI